MKANQDERSPLERNLATWMEHIDRVEYRFKKICGQNEIKFVDEICKKFIAENNTDIIESHTSKLDELLRSIYRYQNEVVSLMGIGTDYKKIDIIVKKIKKVVGWLEEILSAALINVEEVDNGRTTGIFTYQTE